MLLAAPLSLLAMPVIVALVMILMAGNIVIGRILCLHVAETVLGADGRTYGITVDAPTQR